MTMNQANMPRDWQPPAPAWTTRWSDASDPVVAGYFGVQGDDATALESWADAALFDDTAPALVEQGAFHDSRGVENKLYIAYWRLSPEHNERVRLRLEDGRVVKTTVGNLKNKWAKVERESDVRAPGSARS